MIAQILIVIIVAIAVTVFAERRDIQPPLLVAMVGLAASFIPGVPRLELEPEIILGLVLPPMLFSAAADFSFFSFIKRLGSIVNLGVFLVVATTFAVAGVASFAIPGMTFPVALVLAAVIAPPDAVTAITIGRKAGLPSGLMTVLKGESLINDAAALTLFAAAVATVAGTPAFIDNLSLYFIYSAIIAIIVGVALGWAVQSFRVRLSNPSLATVVSVLTPFAAYLLAEELHASGVIAVVAAGFSLGHNAAAVSYAERMQERQFWRTIDTLLETFVFAYIGLQLRFVIDDAQNAGFQLPELLSIAALILLATILVRFAWIYGTAVLGRLRHRGMEKRLKHVKPPRGRRFELLAPFSWKENLVLSWNGMRGVVTLAAAAGIPLLTASGEEFPWRDAILALAFLVTIGTLLLQGLSLPWLIKKLDVSDPRDAEHEQQQRNLARSLSLAAANTAVDDYLRDNDSPDDQQLADMMRRRMPANQKLAGPDRNLDRAKMLALSQTMLVARRNRLIAARDAMELDDSVVREMLEQMDLEQAVADNMQSRLR